MVPGEDPKPERESPIWSREFQPAADGKPAEDSIVTQEELLAAIAAGKTVRIRWAILPAGVSFRHGQIARELLLENCEIRGGFILENIVCAESVIFSGTVFKGGLKLDGAQIKGTLQTGKIRCEKFQRQDGVVLPGKAELKGTSVEGQWTSEGAVFADGIDVQYGCFRGPVSFQSCRFEGESAIFALATYFQTVDFTGARFSAAGASFLAASFRSHLFFNQVQSAGELSFGMCKIDGALSADNCRFWQAVEFGSATISAGLVLGGTRCRGVFNCSSLTVGPVRIDHCCYAKDLIFSQALMRSISITDSVFTRNACCNLSSAEIQGECYIYNSRFGADLSLGSARLGSLNLGFGGKADPFKDDFASLQSANIVLYRDLGLTNAYIQGSMSLYRVLCLGKADFGEMRVDAPADVFLCRFGINEEGDEDELFWQLETRVIDKLLSRQRKLIQDQESQVVFNRSEFRSRMGIVAVFQRPAHFHGMRCQSTFRFLPRCVFHKPVEFYFATFADEANFGGAEFKDKLSLNNAHFQRALKFELLRPPKRTKVSAGVIIEIGECTYNSLQELPSWESESSPGETEEDDLARFLDHLEGDRGSFVFLEQYYRKVGEADYADRVRRHWRTREGLKKRHLAWLWDQLLRRATGYGTRVAPLVMAIIILGAVDIALQIYAVKLELWNADKLTVAGAHVRIAHLIVATAVTVLVVTLGDTFRRSLWPEKS
jgi:hypothetical protein